MRIALDGMGGDHGPATVVAGAAEALEANSELTVLLVGLPEALRPELAKHKLDSDRLQLHEAAEVIDMHDFPAVAVRQKKHSSLHVANRLVKEGQADAVFTAGNTGAAMAVSLLTLGRTPGIIRPGLLVDFPSLSPHGRTSLIDVGANVDCKPKMLAQFAIMGSVHAREMYGIPEPRVGLLSLGEEDTKGNDLIHETRDMLKCLRLRFVGNLEGQDLVNGRADVMVCDGFVGNVLLKFGSGVVRLFVDLLKREILAGGLFSRLAAGAMFPVIKSFYRHLDYKEVGAAPLLGVRGVSAIGHGKSDHRAIKNALLLTARYCELQMQTKIASALQAEGVLE